MRSTADGSIWNVPDALGPFSPPVWNVHVSMNVFPPAGKFAIVLISSHACPLVSKLLFTAPDDVNPIAVFPKNATESADTVYAEFVAAANGSSALGRWSP